MAVEARLVREDADPFLYRFREFRRKPVGEMYCGPVCYGAWVSDRVLTVSVSSLKAFFFVPIA